MEIRNVVVSNSIIEVSHAVSQKIENVERSIVVCSMNDKLEGVVAVIYVCVEDHD